jgi:hypothetical protein
MFQHSTHIYTLIATLQIHRDIHISSGMHLKIFSSAVCADINPYVKDSDTNLIYPYLVLADWNLSVLSGYSFCLN